MITTRFLAEWALRSSILILSGALLLWALRVKDSSIRLAAWIAILCGSLAVPAITAALPKVPLTLPRQTPRASVPVVLHVGGPGLEVEGVWQSDSVAKPDVALSARFDWLRAGRMAALLLYVLVSGALLFRLCFALAMSRRLRRGSRATGQSMEGIEIRESECVQSPVALGTARPLILLPIDWPEWDRAKLNAVLAHERSHIRRRDPAVQLLSAIHRALLWHSPLSWFLHRQIVRVAEEVSDDAAVAAIRDRASYAEMLLDFMQRGVRGANWQGVPMARYGRLDERIGRVLDATALSRGITRGGAAAILVLGAPLAYLVAAANPQRAPQPVVAATPIAPDRTAAPVESAPVRAALVQTLAPQIAAQAAPAAKREPVYLYGLGNVAPFYTVTVRARVDGQLMSVRFQEGGMVEAGQVLATIDPQPYQAQLEQAEAQIMPDQAQLEHASSDLARFRQQRAAGAIGEGPVEAQAALVDQLKADIAGKKLKVDNAKLQLTYTQVTAPISGLAGLRLVDPGNIVRASDATGIVIINQVQPISILFTLAENLLPQVLGRLKEGASLPVEAWNRDNSAKIATGRLTAVDNQIDPTTGTAKLKAVFDNKDGVLFPNEFVNVRLLISNQ